MTQTFNSFAALATAWQDNSAITLALQPIDGVSDDMTPQDAVYDFMNLKRYRSAQEGFKGLLYTIESVEQLIRCGVVAVKFVVPSGQSTTVQLSELRHEAPRQRNTALHNSLGMYGLAIQATADCITHTGRYRGRNKLWNPPVQDAEEAK